MLNNILSSEFVVVRHADGSYASLAEIESQVIRYAIEHHESVAAAAAAIGIGRSTLYRRVQRIMPMPILSKALLTRTKSVPKPRKPRDRRSGKRKAVGCDSRWQPELVL